MRASRLASLLPLLTLVPTACTQIGSNGFAPDSFADQAQLLTAEAGGVVIESGTGAFVVSPPLQGRVMTSAVSPQANGLGFVNVPVIRDPGDAAQFFNYGGEDRLWIGPEGGPFALFFPIGATQVAENWQVPEPMHRGAFTVAEQTADKVVMTREMTVRNVQGTRFDLGIRRTIETPTGNEVRELIGGLLPVGAEWVAFRSRNRVENAGSFPWHRDTGLPCVWVLGMFLPGPDAWVIAPFEGPQGSGADGQLQRPVEASYFGEVPPDRLRVASNFVMFKTDAKLRSKIGLWRSRATQRVAAYDPATGVLTIVEFGPLDRKRPYLVELWDPDYPEPYAGDVVNSYNHGGPETFFEIESSSWALELKPGEAHEHVHTTVHLKLPSEREVEKVMARALGIDWVEVKGVAGW
ncbi:MAG TPA: DUF6786 family protein [Planctomycetota bacterium]